MMCGIFSYFGKTNKNLNTHLDTIKYRGPDNTQKLYLDDLMFFGFHRLSIIGTDKKGDQPMIHPENHSLNLICNGEIYNYLQLADKYQFKLTTGSDCEVILFMYEKFGIARTLHELDGVFMFVIYDSLKKELIASRDPMGVRPGFVSLDKANIAIASEAKSLIGISENIKPFPPGTWFSSSSPKLYNRYFFYKNEQLKIKDEDIISSKIGYLLTEAVKKRLMSEREIGCLLSGGLDSSLITGLVSKYYNGPELNTFSIGMEGSVDLLYAEKVAQYLKTKHHQVEISEDEFLNTIEKVIYNIESYDTTTVRASVGNYLVSKYIKDNTNCKVIFNGDGSDEVCCGYIYLKNAPTDKDLQKESEKLIEELHYFDVLRSDRSISSNGLEPRTPFLDKEFVKYYLSIPPKLKKFDGNKRLEKFLLRKAFENEGLIPDEVLWRRKVAFSDGVSSKSKSWHKIIQTYVDEIINDHEFQREVSKINHCKPKLKESYYYRKIFKKFYDGCDDLIPHFWLPNWSNINDPSARELTGYKE